MSKIQLQSLGFETSDYSSEELNTLTRLAIKNKDVLERKSQSLLDNIVIAGMLTEVRELHTKQSHIYQTILGWVEDRDVAWSSKDFRHTMSKAFEGYEKLPGTEDEKQKMLSSFRSVSALKAILDIDTKLLLDFSREVLKSKDTYTAKEVSNWKKPVTQRNNSYNLPPSPPPSIEPEREMKNITSESEVIDIPSNSVPADNAEAKNDELSKVDETTRAVMRFIQSLEALSVDEVYGNKELVRQIEPHLLKMETLTDVVKSYKASLSRR